MLTLIKNAEIYAPEPLGSHSILFAGNEVLKIGEIDEAAFKNSGAEVKIIDAEGNLVIPGLIDPHVHFIGGGGEGGFATRTPELQLSDMISGGITTAVGLLGTDGTTRHMTSLLAKARGLEEEGVTTYIYTGNYDVDTPTITGSAKDDIILIDKVVGIAEIAISDSRSGQPTVEELSKLAGQARVGGLLSGKAGVVHFHTGPGKAYLSQLHELLDHYEIPPTTLYATHITRSRGLVDDAIRLAARGSFVDITADGKTGEWIRYYKENGGDMNQLTVSSDGNGSLPVFNEAGVMTGLGVASMRTLYEQFVSSVNEHGLPLGEVLPLFTSNTARALKLDRKGIVSEGADADLLILDKDTLALRDVFAKGRRLMEDGEIIVFGTFEKH
ncbi:beta-aspartyl-peptidase [Bhargavaea beijingensis]|uniref:Isoaspartyl dipeptidase n=1 Tax=Bhargavaea beijingensis TaxID=426756 RepID=A0A1G6Y7S0_9BACL|nr:beta-aspartyl-peptidase [Bhargavaea beijingensis]RSK31917.1 beta-aspartyl-peptidase [Bhargavaea beijingensis]SDD85757.1 beta-aspartyl-dipeptidase (metallo-type) [Bhargavaea beijingensis]